MTVKLVKKLISVSNLATLIKEEDSDEKALINTFVEIIENKGYETDDLSLLFDIKGNYHDNVETFNKAGWFITYFQITGDYYYLCSIIWKKLGLENNFSKCIDRYLIDFFLANYQPLHHKIEWYNLVHYRRIMFLVELGYNVSVFCQRSDVEREIKYLTSMFQKYHCLDENEAYKLQQLQKLLLMFDEPV